jgi:hypothetical protein
VRFGNRDITDDDIDRDSGRFGGRRSDVFGRGEQ